MTLGERAEAPAKPEAWHTVTLAAIFAAGMVLRLYGLGSESIWYDELWAVRIARLEPLEIVRASLGDNNPPLYYWASITGCSSPGIPSSP